MIKKSRLSEKEQINLIYDNSFNIKDIPNPSKNIMTYALRLNGMSILYIDQDKVTDDMQLIAYRSNKACLQAMKNPCYIVQIAAIQDMGPSALLYIANQSEEIQLLALKRFKHIRDVNKSTINELSRHVIDDFLDRYITNPTEKVKKEIFKFRVSS